MSTHTATLVIERTDPRDVPMRALKLYVDGQYWKDIAFGKTETREIAPGAHTLKVTNTLYSKCVEFEAEGGEVVRFSAGNLVPSVWATMLVILGIVPYRVFLSRASGETESHPSSDRA